MREINVEFQEQYKRLDKLCKDIYSSSKGVSSYIEDMERTPYNERYAVYNWDNFYKQLKQVRWMRNQLAHEINIDTEFCKQADIDWVKNFRESILKGTDPLASAYKAKQQVAPKKTTFNDRIATKNVIEKQSRQSLWNRIVSKIKTWFS